MANPLNSPDGYEQLWKTYFQHINITERKNPRYFKSAVIFHLICIASYLIAKQYGLALAFLIGLARTAYLPTRKLSIQQTGLIEFAISAIFFILLLTSTL